MPQRNIPGQLTPLPSLGTINSYMACRATFDVIQGRANRNRWAAKRCPNNVDPNPEDTSASACLTDGQISTLEVTY